MFDSSFVQLSGNRGQQVYSEFVGVQDANALVSHSKISTSKLKVVETANPNAKFQTLNSLSSPSSPLS